MGMKFLKADGTVEDGEPLKDHQARMLASLEEYLHQEVCLNQYHGYKGNKPCHDAARFLMITTTTISEDEWGEVIEDKTTGKLKSIEIPAPETETPQLFAVQKSKDDDDCPF